MGKPQVVEQTVEVPKIVVEEKTIKVPKVHNTTVHTCVQNQVQTIEVEKPKIIHKIVQRKKPVFQDHITHVPKVVQQTVEVQQVTQEVPQVQYIDEVMQVPVQKQRQVPMIQK